MAEGRYLHLLVTLTTSSTERGAMGLLATSLTCSRLILACTPLISQESLELAQGTANSDISLSLITSITLKRVGVPSTTGQSFISGSSNTMAIWSSLYPLTQGTRTFIIMNPSGFIIPPPITAMGGNCPPISWARVSKDNMSIPLSWA